MVDEDANPSALFLGFELHKPESIKKAFQNHINEQTNKDVTHITSEPAMKCRKVCVSGNFLQRIRIGKNVYGNRACFNSETLMICKVYLFLSSMASICQVKSYGKNHMDGCLPWGLFKGSVEP